MKRIRPFWPLLVAAVYTAGVLVAGHAPTWTALLLAWSLALVLVISR